MRARALPADSLMVDVLLDQRVAAGIGNAYKSELLFLGRISPAALLGDLDDPTLLALYARAAQLIRANLGGGPRTTRPAHAGGARLWVYGRRDEPCLVCGTRIRITRHGRGQRSTYWCPACQGGVGLGAHRVTARCG